jgi:hypothetical protein
MAYFTGDDLSDVDDPSDNEGQSEQSAVSAPAALTLSVAGSPLSCLRQRLFVVQLSDGSQRQLHFKYISLVLDFPCCFAEFPR